PPPPGEDALPAYALRRLGTTRLRPALYDGDPLLSPDGRYLATGEIDAVRVWDLATGRQRHAISTRPGGYTRLALFSPDGRWLIVTSGQARLEPNAPYEFIIDRLDMRTGGVRLLHRDGRKKKHGSPAYEWLRVAQGGRTLVGLFSADWVEGLQVLPRRLES